MGEFAVDILLIVTALSVGVALVIAAVQRRSRVGPLSLGVLLAAAVVVSVFVAGSGV